MTNHNFTKNKKFNFFLDIRFAQFLYYLNSFNSETNFFFLQDLKLCVDFKLFMIFVKL